MKNKLILFVMPIILLIGILGIVSSVVTTTLWIPANQSTFGVGNIQFNCSAITSIGTLSNVSLYTNEDGTWVQRNSSGSASGFQEFSGYTTAPNTDNSADARGMRLEITQASVSVTNFTKYSSVTATRCLLEWINRTIIATATFSGDTCVFSSPVPVGNGNSYYALVDSSGSNYDSYYGSGAASTGTYLNFGAMFWNGGEQATNHGLIEYVGVSSSSNLNNTNISFTRNIQNNPVIWNCKACNNSNTCAFAANNFTLNIVQTWYNSTSFYSKTEGFTSNLQNATSSYLVYNGVSYLTTKSGQNFTYTLDLNSVGINPFYFNYTDSISWYQTSSINQTVSDVVLALCNSTYSTRYFNLSFKDEGNLSLIQATIPASSFVYYLGNGLVNHTYTFSNTTANWNYSFCSNSTSNLKVVPYVQYANGVGYPQRIWNPTVQNYNSTNVTNQVLYLLNSISGIYVTFQVLNGAEQTISGVDVLATRVVDGVTTEVAKGTTSASGTVTFWLNPDFSHTFTFTKTGYTTYTYTDTPTQSGYTITMGGGTNIPISYNKGINYYIYPTNSSLINDTTYTFGLNVTSNYWELTSFGFNLRLTNGTSIAGGTSTTQGSLISFNYNTTNQTAIYMDYYWIINGTTSSGTVKWNIYNTGLTQWSIKTFFDDLKAYLDAGIFGIDNFGRYLIIFLILFLTVGILGWKYGLTNPLFVTGLIFFVIFFFDIAIGLIPDITLINGNSVPHLLTFVSGLIFVIAIIREVST